MKMEHACGRVGIHSVDAITWRVATKLAKLGRTWALTIDPHGHVMLERPQHAHPDDLLGVFDAAAGHLATSRLIRAELVAAIAERGPPVALRRAAAGSRRRAPKAA